MTRQCKPSEGPWYHDGPPNNKIVWNGPDHRVCFLTSDGPTEDNAALICEAGTVYHETKLTPRKILAQRDELLAALHRAASGAGFQYMTFETREIIETAIANAEKGE